MESHILQMLSLLFLVLTHAAGFIWWAAGITTKIQYIEDWINSNKENGRNIVRLEQMMESIKESQLRIEASLEAHRREEMEILKRSGK